ncbi:uncharacterized protein SPSK_00797 [Sporothrix schenckii 1099-18]|nr:uncharacterized protein SPSK_00797 [Sporothrix schenckii 1099-18]KJR81844.1 hypothetical protein SPSK_00797 [Sporothrix schenckii 1099-18]
MLTQHQQRLQQQASSFTANEKDHPKPTSHSTASHPRVISTTPTSITTSSIDSLVVIAAMKPVIAIPATLALVYRAYSKKSLTPSGIFAATLTAIAHAVHPWNLPFVLLAVFFLAGSRVTHVKENVKATLTLPARGGPNVGGGEGPRTHVQVFANSLVASVLTLLHAYQLHQRKQVLLDLHAGGDAAAAAAAHTDLATLGSLCYAWRGDLLVIGIVANYAAVAADTFSSELGILSRATPRLITSPTLRKVPRGTNGGVTLGGLAAGLLGSVVIVTAAMLFLPLCTSDTTRDPLLFGTAAASASAAWSGADRRALMGFLVLWGLLGSVVDSVLGGLLQRSVRDTRTGKILEGEGGIRVLVSEDAGPQHGHSKTDADKPRQPSRVVENGWDLLDNNDVNFLMAVIMSVSAMAVAGWYWGVPLSSIIQP